jgi:hypothetical protein
MDWILWSDIGTAIQILFLRVGIQVLRTPLFAPHLLPSEADPGGWWDVVGSKSFSAHSQPFAIVSSPRILLVQ